jgi:hypothetical protein
MRPSIAGLESITYGRVEDGVFGTSAASYRKADFSGLSVIGDY